jgi:hypothetical protein
VQQKLKGLLKMAAIELIQSNRGRPDFTMSMQLCWPGLKKTRMNNPEVAISGRVLLEKANNFVKELAHSEDNISAA